MDLIGRDKAGNQVIDILYILKYYHTGILFVVLRTGWIMSSDYSIMELLLLITNCLNPFNQLLYSSFYTKTIITKLSIIIQY